MTWTVAADAVMPVCARAAVACPHAASTAASTTGSATTAIASAVTAYTAVASTEPAVRGPGAVPRASHRPADGRAAPRGTLAVCGPGRRSRRLECARPPVPRQLAVASQQRGPGRARPLARHPHRGNVTVIAGWPTDPGRDVI
jgi:hypothetical protein